MISETLALVQWRVLSLVQPQLILETRSQQLVSVLVSAVLDAALIYLVVPSAWRSSVFLALTDLSNRPTPKFAEWPTSLRFASNVNM